MEDVDWWTKKHRKSPLNELREMAEEITLLKALWTHQRALWLVSFPFHFGLYLLMTFIGLLIAGGILSAAGVPVAADGGFVGMALFYGTSLIGFAGFGLGVVGASGLLLRRLTDPGLRDYTGPLDYLNLLAFIVLFVIGLVTLGVDPGAGELRAYFQALVTLKAAAGLSTMTIVAIVVANAMVIYIPLTHMSHFVAKYFTYHSVRWNDEALEPGGALDRTISEQLHYPISWSASHIHGGHHRTWA